MSRQASDSMSSENSLLQTFQLKMVCLAKKTAKMPTEEEHDFLLIYNLGLRKWKVDMNWNWRTFSQVVYNLYPRLRSVGGYNLYIASKEKKLFMPIPEEFNTPKKIRSHLGPLFSVLLSPSGYLMIVPVFDIVLPRLVMEEKQEHLRQIEVRQTQAPEPDRRHLCLICDNSEMTPGTGSFYRIMEETPECYGGRGETIVKKLTDILGFNIEAKKELLASMEICTKCLQKTTKVVWMEEQVKKNIEELVSKYQNKNDADCKQTEPASGPPMANGHQMMTNSGNFLVQPMAHDQRKHLQYGRGIIQFYRPQPYPAMRHTGGLDKNHDDMKTSSGKANGSVASETIPSVISYVGRLEHAGALSQEETLRARTHPPRSQIEEDNTEDS